MLQTHSSRWTVALLAFGALIGWSTTAAAEVPDAITHQGRLLDSNGEPVTGTTQMTFTLYDSETGGAVLWEGQAEVEVGDSGFYSVELGGSNNPIDSQVLQGGNAWLGVAVEGGEEMSPRLKLNTSPYAQVASRAESVADGSVEESSLSSDLQTKVDEANSNPQWDDLQNVPEGLDDGDDDTLGGLSCQPGYVAKATQSGWTCQEDETNTDWNDLNNVPSDIADGDDDTLDQLGMNCQTGYVPKWDGSSWTCQPDRNTKDWNELNNVPSDIADGDQDTLGGISCQSGQVAEYDGSNWTCVDRSTYSDSDAVQAVANDDRYVQNSGDSMSGNLEMSGNRVRGLGAPTQNNDATTKEYVDQEITTSTSNLKDNLFWTAAVSLDNLTYEDEEGNTETLNRLPSTGQTECSSGQSVCIHNTGNDYRISILIPDSVASRNNAPEFGNLKCWATAPGDNEPGGRDFQNAVASYATDINGGHDSCANNDNVTDAAGGEECIGIETTGTYNNSHTTYGVVCLNL